MAKAKTVSKYQLYEASVQSPNWQVDYLPQFHQWLTGKPMVSMREDFCGSGRISCEWVKRSKKNRAVGLDIDAHVLNYAETVNKTELTTDEQKRVSFLKQNVLKPTKEKFDFIGAYNFSYYDFHERKELLKYAKAAFQSLKAKGTLFLEITGGPGFLESHQEDKVFTIKGFGKVRQVWEQHQYDPIAAINDYSIHFQLPDGTWMNDAFTYHWRIWNIRELREVLADAGFKKTVVLWEDIDEKGNGKGEFLPTDQAENVHSWIAYVVGVKG